VIATAYLVYKGSSESGDTDQRIEVKIDALLREAGLDPAKIELELSPEYRPAPQGRDEHRRASRVG
jgi:hypothetical protein